MFFQFLTYLFFKDHVNHKTGTCYYTTIGAPIESNKKDQTGIVTYM